MLRRLIYAALSIAVFCSCSDASNSTSAATCTPGDTRACVAGDGCSGKASCGGSPPSWGTCVCDQGPLPDAGVPLLLGNSCKNTNECAAGSECLLPSDKTLFGGAPPAGLCVANCSVAQDCSAFANGVCVNVAAPGSVSASPASGLCFERCALGDSASPKCHGSAHLACTPFDDGSSLEGYCRPLCTTDSECPTGACDPARSVCISSRVVDTTFGRSCGSGTSIGAAGEAGAGGGDNAGAGANGGAGTDADGGAGTGADSDASCSGQCVTLNGSSAVCTRRCVFGDTSECAPASGGLRRGACAFVTPGGSIGDLGYCAELCDCKDDCVEPSFLCDAFDDANLEQAFGRKGACTPPEVTAKHPLVCEQ